MRNRKVQLMAQAAVIAALYVVLTELFAPISFREVQVRISEMLTILPFFTGAAVPGLFVGCLIANLLGGAIPVDIICGSLATLAGAYGTWLIGRADRAGSAAKAGSAAASEPGKPASKLRYLAPLPPIIANTIVVPFVLYYGYGVNLPIPLQMLTVGLGEVVSCGILGTILLTALYKYRGRIFGTRTVTG